MNVREKKTEIFLKDRGYIVHTVSKPAHFGMSHDVFGLFDHVVVAGENASKFMPKCFFVQTKSRMIYGKQKIPYENFPMPSYLFVWTKASNRYTVEVVDLKNNVKINPEEF